MRNYARIGVNILFIAMVSIVAIETVLVGANFDDFMFMLRRKDIMEAAKRVEFTEQKAIEYQIRKIKENSVKSILAPTTGDKK